MKNKKMIIFILVAVFCIGLVGLTYAAFTYSRVGTTNSKQIVGDIYMHYKESNVLTLENAMPSSTYDSTKYFEFTIDGKNTYTKKDIYYEIDLTHGSDPNISGRTIRLDDKFLKFRLVEVVNNIETEIFTNKSYNDLTNKRIHVETIPKNTTSEITKKYRIYMWIDNNLKIGNADDSDYSTSDWNKIYASIKVNVAGDFAEKEVDKTAADKVLASINAKTTCNPSTAIVETKTLNPNMTEEELQTCVNYVMDLWRGLSNDEVEAFCQGTGEVYGNTFQGWLDNGFPPEFITYFKENNIITTSIENVGYDEDGVIYLSGSNDCVDFNYVWYSGKLWRIVAIYDDGSMKLITENNITSISYNESDNVNFQGSYMYQWLNEDFLDTLVDYEEVIDTTKTWNATNSNEQDISTPLMKTTIVSANVGLLNSYECYKIYQNTGYSDGYLPIDYYWWLLNSYNASNIWYVYLNGSVSSNTSAIKLGVRPSIYLKSEITFSSGLGLLNDPYVITTSNKDTGKTNELLTTRVSGEYIKFSNDSNAEKFRIVGIENNTTKIVAMDYVTYDNNGTPGIWKVISSNSTFGSGNSDTYWDHYLNNTWYNNLSFKDIITSGTYYIGIVGDGNNYKLSICSTVTSASTKDCEKTTSNSFNVGLLRYGEMFATQQSGGYHNSNSMWLITKYASGVWFVDERGFVDGDYGPRNQKTVRPSYYLKSDVKIVSGTGTPNDPYVVS